MPQRFNGSWNATYPNQPQYTGHVRMEVVENSFRFVSGDIFLNGQYDGWWRGNGMRVDGNRLTFDYNVISINGQNFSGRLDLTIQNPNQVSGTYTDQAGGDTGRFTMNRIGNEYRQISVEIDALNGAAFPPTVNHVGRTWTLADIYREAGINLTVNQNQNNIAIPTQPGGAPTPLTDAILHNIMMQNSNLTPTQWQGYLLMATNNPGGDFGIMYDIGNGAPREGAAVFVNTINASIAANANTAILRTTAHEFGHALNLLHPITTDNTIMSQTRVLQSLGNFPDNTNFTFREIEIEHLRHHRFPFVVFGGDPFGNDRHDSAFGEGEDVVREDIGDRRVKAYLKVSQDRIGFGEPLHVSLTVQNISNRNVKIEDHFEPSSQVVHFYLIDPSGITRHISPIRVRDVSSSPIILKKGQGITRDLTLLVDSNGPIFTVPGIYELYADYCGVLDRPWCNIRTQPLKIRLLYPTPTQENVVIELEKRASKLFFGLNGADHLLESVGHIRELTNSKKKEMPELCKYLDYLDGLRLSNPFYDIHKDTFRDAQRNESISILKAINTSENHCFGRIIEHGISQINNG
jgi:hypothetical protein